MNTQEPVNGRAWHDQNGGKILGKPTSSAAKNQMRSRKNIALIAHDNCKRDLVEWVDANAPALRKHMLFATATTGQTLMRETDLFIFCFKSGPLGGDQQIGAKIAEGAIDFLIFFWEPLQPQPHDPDVKALLRLATVWNIPVACNRATADFLITSSLMNEKYDRILPANELPVKNARPSASNNHDEITAVA